MFYMKQNNHLKQIVANTTYMNVQDIKYTSMSYCLSVVQLEKL